MTNSHPSPARSRKSRRRRLAIATLAGLAVLLWGIDWLTCNGRGRLDLGNDEIDLVDIDRNDPALAALLHTVDREGTAAALDSLEALAGRDPRVWTIGHHFAHAIGRYSILRSGYDARVFNDCRQLFQSGCYHGVLQDVFHDEPEILPHTVRVLCDSIVAAGSPPIRRLECAHGLGHGLTVRLKYNLPAAVGRCGLLTLEAERDRCYGGVFMENAVHVVRGGSSGAASPRGDEGAADPDRPCDAFDGPAARACWRYQAIILLALNNNDIGRTFDACRASGAAEADCEFGIGTQLTRPDHDDAQIIAGCEKGGPPGAAAVERCLVGAVHPLVAWDWKAGRALGFCAAAPEATRPACFEAVGRRVRTLFTDAAGREAACAGTAEEYQSACRTGAGLKESQSSAQTSAS